MKQRICRNCVFRQVRNDLPVYRVEPRLGVKCVHPEVRNTSPLFIVATTLEGRAGSCGPDAKFFEEIKE